MCYMRKNKVSYVYDDLDKQIYLLKTIIDMHKTDNYLLSKDIDEKGIETKIKSYFSSNIKTLNKLKSVFKMNEAEVIVVLKQKILKLVIENTI